MRRNMTLEVWKDAVLQERKQSLLLRKQKAVLNLKNRGKPAEAHAHVVRLIDALKACSKTRHLERGKQVHAEAVVCHNAYITNALINMYAKCESMEDARQVFEDMNPRTVVSWNVLILGYVDNGQGQTALDMFTRMRSEGLVPDSVTLVAALKACASLAAKGGWTKCRDRGKVIENITVENDCNSVVYVGNTLVDMYAKCSNMVDARWVFDGMKHPNLVSWNALILGYAENGQGLPALDMFARMTKEGIAPNCVTLLAALKACSSLAVKGVNRWVECRGKEIHNIAVQYGCNSDVYVESTLVDMYAKCGSIAAANDLFHTMKHPNVVSWNVLILGYAENRQGHVALDLFTRMRAEGPAPDSTTFMAALKACGLVGALEFGRALHLEISSRNDLDVVLVTCLVDFYAKCGSLVEAERIFYLHAETRNVVTWTALLAGYSSCGDNQAVFELFDKMQSAGFQPNGVTFLCILMCCNHAGLVEKGKECFDTMTTKYGVLPNIEHYNCLVDIFGRANQLGNATAMLKLMPYSPNSVTWTTILGACRKWKNLEIGWLAFQSLIDLNLRDAAAYLQMEQIYASKGMLQEKESLMELRKKLKDHKKLGETYWTNEAGEVHTFSVDSQHPQISEIRGKWESMVVMLRQHGYTPNLLSDEEVCSHSERLALVCALMNTELKKTVRIVKNLRICDDCHTVTALISKLVCRTIICTDASRIHFFMDGNCSCQC